MFCFFFCFVFSLQQQYPAQLQGGDSDRQTRPDSPVLPRRDRVPPSPQREFLMIMQTNVWKNTSPSPRLFAHHAAWHLPDICHAAVTFFSLAAVETRQRSRRETKRSLHGDNDDESAIIGLFLVSCMHYGRKRSGKMWAASKLLHLTRWWRGAPPPTSFPFSVENPHTDSSICLFFTGHSQWNLPLMGRKRNVSDDQCFSLFFSFGNSHLTIRHIY